MDKFFIFLDIDGTLWDKSDCNYPFLVRNDLNPKSVNAVNTLVFELEKRKYSPIFVIISARRNPWDECQMILYENGITTKIPMIKLPLNKSIPRGHKISIFLHDYYHNNDFLRENGKYSILDKLKTNFCKKVNNYVVIDDHRDWNLNIPLNHFIKPDMNKRCFDLGFLNDFLELLDSNFETDLEK